MKTSEAIQLAGGKASSLAELLGITPGAVSQWGDEVPSARVWQLQVLRPDWFAQDGTELAKVPPSLPPSLKTAAGVANAR